MTKFQKYVDFKEKHPYSETHQDFEADITPVTILDIDQMKMNCYFPDEESRSSYFSKQLQRKRQLAEQIRRLKRE